MRGSPKRVITCRSGIHGIGLFTLVDLYAQEFCMEYAGELIRTQLADPREQGYDAEGLGTYFFRVDDQYSVDATCRSNCARFLNHSCTPALKAETLMLPERTLVVLRIKHFVPKYTELTLDYLMSTEDDIKIPCTCGARACRGTLN
ncbi:hypothetical protein BU14_0381s0005 [Porphyra umbilicalis]|uniref:[histone H3]-lysine(4) N-trimethyltransferase n=1 Tax=Porphyra umbilicalis TaxID=2786 RepID=A0A1X6NWZ0_PORUM|nr:hypothetical protein BU14_0381s0005 [Porphyra umbilicalis]|eukprot:OSX73065.1 hypothetical protein BU14_0381s0005 [Porphyra umbilicalis]